MNDELPPLTPAEKRAIVSLKRLAKRWPKSLWLFSGSGELHVMQRRNGERAMLPDGGVDPAASVANIAIPNDGGDW